MGSKKKRPSPVTISSPSSLQSGSSLCKACLCLSLLLLFLLTMTCSSCSPRQLFLLLTGVLGVAGPASASAHRQLAVVAYLPEWRHEGADWGRICRHVSHLLLFSCEVTAAGDIVARDRMPRRELMEEARRAADRHGTRLMLCLGGNGRSAGFMGMVRSQKNRCGE